MTVVPYILISASLVLHYLPLILVNSPQQVTSQAGGVLQMYEISTRPWLYLLSQKYSRNITTFNDIPDSEFQTLKNKGIDIIWMMGVWELGNYGLNHDRTDPGLLAYYPTVLQGFTLADVIGSPYAVVTYTTNPDLGSDSDLAALKRKLNGMGLKLMLDFVPNHSAVDCPWTSSNPKYFIRAASSSGPYDPSRYLNNGIAFGWGGYGDAWTDTVQFNYWEPTLKSARITELLKIASFSDYIRCDVAYLALNNIIQQNWASQLSYWGYSRPSSEFWVDAIKAVKSQYDVKFLGEVYNPNQQALIDVGFDFIYEKTLYDHLAGGNLDDIRGYITGTPLAFHQHGAHFVENHDEPRAASFFGSNSRADTANAVSMTLPGLRFYFMGQENGYFNKLDVHLRRATPESTNTGVNTYYNALWKALSLDVMKVGSWNYRTAQNTGDSWRLLTWEWVYNDQKVLVVINYSDTQGSGYVVCPLAKPVDGNDNIPLTELLTGTVYTRSAKEMSSTGLFVVLGSWSVQMFQYN